MKTLNFTKTDFAVQLSQISIPDVYSEIGSAIFSGDQFVKNMTVNLLCDADGECSDINVEVEFHLDVEAEDEAQCAVLCTNHAGHTLAHEIDEAKVEIDLAASRARSRFISDGVGQDAIYVHKESQARLFAANGYPEDQLDDLAYSLIKAEVAVYDGQVTGQECADTIISLSDQWKVVGGMIETTRLKSKNIVKSQADSANVKAKLKDAFDALDQFKP